MKSKILFLVCACLLASLNGCAVLDLQRAQSELDVSLDVAYLPDAHARHRLDIFMPEHARDVPVVFFVHGGYWNSQDKAYYRDFTGLYANIGIALARQGIGVVVTDYRISPEVGIEGELSDLSDALRWTQEHIWRYGGDAHRMVLAGHSAGGHMVALLGLEARRLQAAGVETSWIRGLVPMSPIVDINQMAAAQNAEFNALTTYPVFGRAAADWARYSPSSYFGRYSQPAPPPTLISLGEQDFAYLLAQNQTARERLKQLRAPVEYLIAPGYRHEDLVLKFGLPADPLLPALRDFVFRVTK